MIIITGARWNATIIMQNFRQKIFKYWRQRLKKKVNKQELTHRQNYFLLPKYEFLTFNSVQKC